MSRKFDINTVVAIIISSILLTMANFGLWEHKLFYNEVCIPICGIIVIVIAALYGLFAGVIVPIASCLIFGAVIATPIAIEEMIALLMLGAATGHYMEIFKVTEGEFEGKKIIDYCVIQLIVSIVTWMFVRPVYLFYVYRYDIGANIISSIYFLVAAYIIQVCVCLPLLLLINYYIKRGKIMEEARS